MGRQLGRDTTMAPRRLPSSLVAALALVLAVALASGEAAGSPGPDPGGTLREAGRALLWAFWIWTAIRAGRAWAGRFDPGRSASGPALRTFLGALLYALTSAAASGALRRFDLLSLTLVHAVAFVLWVPARGSAARVPTGGGRCSPAALARGVRERPLQALSVLLLIALGVANGAWAILSPVYHIDDLVYHLTFPIEWAQLGTLETHLVPFGNHSPAYHPKNIELLYGWLFLPLRRIEVVSLVQVAFAAASVCAAYEVLRLLRVGAGAALTCACLFLASATVTRFFDSGYVDFAFMFGFLMSLVAILRLRATPAGDPDRAGWIELAAALGVFAGTKSFGILLTVTLLAPAGLLLLRQRLRHLLRAGAGRLLAGLLLAGGVWVVTGGWWTLRNLLLTGNPIFPMQVEVAGIVLFDGAYARAAFNSAPLRRLVPLIPPPFWIPIGIGAVATLGRALRPAAAADERARALVTVVLPLALAAVFSLLLPTGNPRFVLAILPLAAGSMAVALEARPLLSKAFAATLLAALVWTLVSRAPSLLMPVRGGSLLHTPLVDVAFGATCASLILLILALTLRLARPAAFWVLIAALGTPALVVATRTSDPAREHVPQRVSQAWRPYLELEREHGPARLAVTGTNQTLRAYGRRYANQVRYINVNDSGTALFHEHFRRLRDTTVATPHDESGFVYYRAQPDYGAWLRNLEAQDIGFLLVAPLPPWAREKGYARDRRGFPLEHSWAVEHPERFEQLASYPGLRIFRVLPRP